MFYYTCRALVAASFLACSTSGLHATTLEPNAVLASGINVMVKKVGTIPSLIAPSFGAPNNFGSPVAAGGSLYGIDQYGMIHRVNPDGTTTMMQVPPEVMALGLSDRESVLNISESSDPSKIFVTFTTDTPPTTNMASGYDLKTLPAPLPGMVPVAPFDPSNLKPAADLYRLTPDDLTGLPPFIPPLAGVKYQVVYEFDVSGDDLINPTALTAFEVQSSVSGHHGGGMATTSDGKILFATGDNLPFGLNGQHAPQDDAEMPSKLYLIDPATGATTLVAKGLRNVQHMQVFMKDGEEYLAMTDIGGVTAEELNVVKVDDLRDTGTIENFGWGISPDGNGREGTFYVGDGIPFILGTQPPATGMAPIGEPGYIQPLAQYGRNSSLLPFIAISGPIFSPDSFNLISLLFGDLASGDVFATVGDLSEIAADIFAINLYDNTGDPTSLSALAGGRPDPRFFTFADGTAGVLLEATGDYYRLTELSSSQVQPVPLPASILFLGVAVAALRANRSRRQ